MRAIHHHRERHLVERIGWLRAAVLGANDGIVSTGSLIVGVAAASSGRHEALLAGVSGLVAGALSMAAGEYVSVSSQSDTEKADLARERQELATMPEAELDELTAIYVARGVDEPLARQVATQMTARDGLSTHARDELGISVTTAARPVQAALTSAATFSAGALVPLLATLAAPQPILVPAVGATSVLCLALLGAVGAQAGGASRTRGVLRVTFWGVVAMLVTAGVGSLFGQVAG